MDEKPMTVEEYVQVLQNDNREASTKYLNLLREHNELLKSHLALQLDHGELQSKHIKLQDEHLALLKEYNAIAQKYLDLLKQENERLDKMEKNMNVYEMYFWLAVSEVKKAWKFIKSLLTIKE